MTSNKCLNIRTALTQEGDFISYHLSEEPSLFQLPAAALVSSDFHWGGGQKRDEVPLGLKDKSEVAH